MVYPQSSQVQYSLPGVSVALADRNRRGIGAWGENYVAAKFQEAGFKVSFARIGERRGDLRIVDPETGEIYRVEVKTARRAKDGKWRFTLYKRGHTDHANSDFVVLLAVLKSGRAVPFVIPSQVLCRQRQAVITSHPENYSGKLAKYRRKGVIGL